MSLFESIVVLHVICGTVGLVSFWVPIAVVKGGASHRSWGQIAARAFMAAGVLAIAMALLSLFGPEQRLPMIKDRVLFRGLFGWMMLYLGMLTLSFADYGLSVVRHRSRREALRRPRHQLVFAAVTVSALNCGVYGLWTGQPLMALVALIGLIATATQLFYIWRARPPRGGHVAEHFRSLLGMGISAYTAFLSVGLIRLVPDHVFNPVIWAIPSIIGVALIAWFTFGRARAAAGSLR
ncbi:hypothetical protein [Novosphingobium sp. Chol11]|uniref:hypothetical protein n=1 Tax=Novosphingobium sp. Chol11 TaxID=1385763 RepID=UPI0025F5734C|nr:hypothetical protein [Novosphingobium sp. Chol11]